MSRVERRGRRAACSPSAVGSYVKHDVYTPEAGPEMRTTATALHPGAELSAKIVSRQPAGSGAWQAAAVVSLPSAQLLLLLAAHRWKHCASAVRAAPQAGPATGRARGNSAE